ncbi:MAG: hypothetical protein ABL940_05970 [Bacteroidia bacterium]
MNKLVATIITITLCITNAVAQNTNLDYKLAVKLYNTTSLQKFNPVIVSNYAYSTSDFVVLKPTVAVQWKTKKNNFREIELSDFNINKKSTHYVTNVTTPSSGLVFTDQNLQSSIALKYEYVLGLNSAKNYKLVPSVGLGLHSFYGYSKNFPQVSSSFYTSTRLIGTTAYIAPRLTYFITSKLLLDFNIPVYLTEFSANKRRNPNPSIPVANRTIHTFNFKAFPNVLSCRIGIGLKI